MTLLAQPMTLRTRNVPYGSETILVAGEPAEARSFCREALAARGYEVLEAANLQHADTIIDQLDNNIDLILGCVSSNAERGALATWHGRYWMLPLLVVNVDDCRATPETGRAEVALRVRLALEAARPSRSILIVDENQCERAMLAGLLQTAGYAVREASNGKEAMRQLASNTPELLLTDIVMPEKDGLELLQEVRKQYPKVATIAMSGTTRADRYLTIARLLGAKCTLEKPLSVDQLLRVLREVQDAAAEQ
jgi:CheY-like chemotaxis protein